MKKIKKREQLSSVDYKSTLRRTRVEKNNENDHNNNNNVLVQVRRVNETTTFRRSDLRSIGTRLGKDGIKWSNFADTFRMTTSKKHYSSSDVT